MKDSQRKAIHAKKKNNAVFEINDLIDSHKDLDDPSEFDEGFNEGLLTSRRLYQHARKKMR